MKSFLKVFLNRVVLSIIVFFSWTFLPYLSNSAMAIGTIVEEVEEEIADLLQDRLSESNSILSRNGILGLTPYTLPLRLRGNIDISPNITVTGFEANKNVTLPSNDETSDVLYERGQLIRLKARDIKLDKNPVQDLVDMASRRTQGNSSDQNIEEIFTSADISLPSRNNTDPEAVDDSSKSERIESRLNDIMDFIKDLPDSARDIFVKVENVPGHLKPETPEMDLKHEGLETARNKVSSLDMPSEFALLEKLPKDHPIFGKDDTSETDDTEIIITSGHMISGFESDIAVVLDDADEGAHEMESLGSLVSGLAREIVDKEVDKGTETPDVEEIKSAVDTLTNMLREKAKNVDVEKDRSLETDDQEHSSQIEKDIQMPLESGKDNIRVSIKIPPQSKEDVVIKGVSVDEIVSKQKANRDNLSLFDSFDGNIVTQEIEHKAFNK